MSSRMNDLDGKTWLQYSFSIWRDIEKTPVERKLKHPAMFPTQLASKLIKTYSKKGEVILDPFLGSGSTAVSAYELMRKGIGFELSKEYSKLSADRIKYTQSQLGKNNEFVKPVVYNDTIFNITKYLKPNSVDLVITSPPYWDILNQKRSVDGQSIRNYSDSKDDLGNIEDYELFLTKLQQGFKEAYTVLKKGKYFIVVVMDIRKKSKFYPFHIDVVKKMTEIGFELDDIVIWDRQKEYNNMRPLGYPYVFRVNKVHEFILIFKK